jgi:hydrogenase maturation protease
MNTAARRVVIIGVGNPWCRDDGAGWVAADLAGGHLGPTVAVVHSDGEPARLIEEWSGADLAVVVDAVRTGAPPGRIHQLGRLDAAVPPAVGSHGLGLADAVHLGAAVGRLPRRLVIFGIEVADTTAGRGLTADVARAVQTVAHFVERAVSSSSEEVGGCA